MSDQPINPTDPNLAEPVDAATEASSLQESPVVPALEEAAEVGQAVESSGVLAPESVDAVEEPSAEGGVGEESSSVSGEEAVVPVDESAAEVKPLEDLSNDEQALNMQWYILKVQSNREDSIREGILRRIAIGGLERFFGDIIVPVEKVTEVKGGKKRVVKRKLYPGYLIINMEFNDDTWFLVRETPGVGDFTGAAGRPTPMLPHEIERILAKTEEKSDKTPKLKIAFAVGDKVKIKEGTFENFEGTVDAIDQTNGQVTVMINIFGRSTPVTLEYWQIEAL